MTRIPIVVVNDTRVDRHHGCARVMRTLRLLAERRGMEVIGAAPAHRDWRRDERFLRALDRARLVIVNGEGTIHHDRPAGAVLLEAGRAARERGIPAALVNASWHANGAAFAERLRDFALVAVRESASLREVESGGGGAVRVPDLFLYLPHQAAGRRCGVGVGDCVAVDVTARLRALRRALGGRCVPIVDLAREPLDRLRLLRYGATVSPDRTPLGLARGVLASWKEARAVVGTDDEFLRVVASLELLVTGRFHAVCSALVTRTPFLGVETNTHKIVAMLQDAGAAAWRCVRVDAVDAAILERGRCWEADEEEAVADFVADARRRIDGLFDEVRALA